MSSVDYAVGGSILLTDIFFKVCHESEGTGICERTLRKRRRTTTRRGGGGGGEEERKKKERPFSRSFKSTQSSINHCISV